MRVGIDYWPATTHAPGIGRYVRELVRALIGLPERPELALFDVGPGRRSIPPSALGLPSAAQARSTTTRARSRLPRRLFGLLAADRWLGGVDVFHRAFPALPRVAQAREILPVAELPPAADAGFQQALQRAAGVIVFSHASQAELLERFALPTERVHYLPVGCDHWRRDLGLVSVPRPERERFLVLGARTPNRRPLPIAQAFGALVRQGLDVELEFIGRPGSADAELRAWAARTGLEARLSLTEPHESELPRRVASASVLVHLNSVENTPVTPLEAFSLGLSVVATRLPAFEEALLDEPVWVAPDEDGPALAAALAASLELARDPERRAARIALADRYTWHAHARKTVELWRHVAAGA